MNKSFPILTFLTFFNTSVFAFDNVISFGDSLSDGGSLDFFGVKTRYISGDDTLLYNEILSLNLTGKNLLVGTEGGTNFSVSGSTASNTPLLIFKTEQQVKSYLESNNGKASANDLFIFWAGANDITADVEMSLLTLQVGKLFEESTHYQLSDAPQAVARQVGMLLDNGAGLVVVPNLPDAGLSPWTATALFSFSQMLLGGNILDLPSLYAIQDQSLRQQENVYGEEQRQQAVINSLRTVLNNYGLALPEALITTAYRTILDMESRLTRQFNHDLELNLSALTGNIAYVDSFGLFREIIDNPKPYGFDNILVPICQIGVGAPTCNSSQPTWHDDKTYLFSDWFHPSPAAHAVIAQYITALINAPSLMSQLSRPMQTIMLGNNNFLLSHLTLARQDTRPATNYQIFGGYQGQRYTEKNASNHLAGQSNIGVIINANQHLSVGGSLSLGNTNNLRLGPNLQTDYATKTLSLFTQLTVGNTWLNSQLSVGDIKFTDVRRIIPLGKALRTERSNVKGNFISGSMNIGYDFTPYPTFTVGPHMSLLYRNAKVKDFAEKTSTSSSMMFSDYRVADSLFTTGLHFSWQGDKFVPFSEINYTQPLFTHSSKSKASLKTTNTKFSTIINAKEESTINLKLGTSYKINDATKAYVTLDLPQVKNGLSRSFYSAGLNFIF